MAFAIGGDGGESSDPDRPAGNSDPASVDQDILVEDQTEVTSGDGNDRIASVGILEQAVLINSGGGNDLLDFDAVTEVDGAPWPMGTDFKWQVLSALMVALQLQGLIRCSRARSEI